MKHKDYVIRTAQPTQYPDDYRLIRIDGLAFPNTIHAVKYLRDKCGFSVKDAKEFIDSLPEGRVGIEI